MLERFFAAIVGQVEGFETRLGTNVCLAYFIIQVILVAIVNFLVKFLTNVPAFEMLYLRSVLVYLFNFAIMTEYGIDPYPEDQRKMRFLAMRGIFNFLATCFYVLSIKILTVTEATTLFYTNSIWIGFLGWFLLKDRISRYEILASLFGFAGIMFVIRPDIIFGLGREETSVEYFMNFWGILAGVAASISFTVLFMLIRRTKTQLNILIYNQIYNLMNLVIAPIGVFYQGWYWVSWEEIGLIVLMGFLHYGSKLCFNRGIQLEKSGKASFLGYFQIFISFGIDVVLGIDVDLTSLIGGALVLVSAVFMFIKPQN